MIIKIDNKNSNFVLREIYFKMNKRKKLESISTA